MRGGRPMTLAGAGGEGGIRTLDTLARIPVFETGLFSHSSTSPELRLCARAADGRAGRRLAPDFSRFGKGGSLSAKRVRTQCLRTDRGVTPRTPHFSGARGPKTPKTLGPSG